MTKQLPGVVAAVVGQRMKRFRADTDTSAARVAREACELADLKWTENVVNRIERGRRGMYAEELLALPAILSAATGRTITLSELLGDEIEIGSLRIHGGEAEIPASYRPLAVRKAEAIIARHEDELARMQRHVTGIARPRRPPTKKREE